MEETWLKRGKRKDNAYQPGGKETNVPFGRQKDERTGT